MRVLQWSCVAFFSAACLLSGCSKRDEHAYKPTSLLWAVRSGDLKQARSFIDSGANINAKNEFSASPLSEAAYMANAAMVKMLLEAGANPNTTGADGETPLMIVAKGSDVRLAELLLNRGADVNAVEQQRKQTALMWAAAQKQAAMVILLASRGADVNARAHVNPTCSAMFSDSTPRDWPSNVSSEPRSFDLEVGGFTPLLYAAREGCLDCVKALISAKAKIDMPDPQGITPLMMAIQNLHFDTAAFLIEAGANLDKWDYWGRSALYHAVDMNTLPHGGRYDRPSTDETPSLKIIEMLLNAGANPNLQLKLLPPYRARAPDRAVDLVLGIGATPLLRAAKAFDAAAIALLLKKGANPNLPQGMGVTPVMAASGFLALEIDTRGLVLTADTQQRSIEALRLLLEAGAQIDSKMLSAQGAAFDPKRIHGFSAATSTFLGQTALHSAARWGWNDVVQFLVDRGADLRAKDALGKTPLDSALGKAGGGGSRGFQRIDIHEDTAALIRKLMKRPRSLPTKNISSYT